VTRDASRLRQTAIRPMFCLCLRIQTTNARVCPSDAGILHHPAPPPFARSTPSAADSSGGDHLGGGSRASADPRPPPVGSSSQAHRPRLTVGPARTRWPADRSRRCSPKRDAAVANADFRTAGWGQPVPGPVTGLTCDDTVSPAQLGFLHCGEIAAERLRVGAAGRGNACTCWRTPARGW